jgi:hypothetical protein
MISQYNGQDATALVTLSRPRHADRSRAPLPNFNRIQFSHKDLIRFWRNVQQAASPQCWLWIGRKNTKGYGIFRVYGPTQNIPAHRFAWTAVRGEIPNGLTIDHLCRNPGCVNPDHLEPVTMRENTLRGVSVVAECARKTHCKRGHELTPENMRSGVGGRQCRVCRNITDRALRAVKDPVDRITSGDGLRA